MDYTGNSDKSKKSPGKDKPEKKIEKVISGDAQLKKKPIGRKFKDLIVAADFRSVVRYIGYDVLLPAARNTIVDSTTRGIERMMYGEGTMRRRDAGPGPRITYNSPINRGNPYASTPGNMPQRRLPQGMVPNDHRAARHQRDDIILGNRDEADLVLERMQDILNQYDIVSVADLKELVGLPASYIDNAWGWTFLGDVQIRQIREGYLLDLPSSEPIQ